MPKKFSDSERIRLALASLNEGVVVTKYCADHGISRSALYRSRKELLSCLSELLRKRESHPRSF